MVIWPLYSSCRRTFVASPLFSVPTSTCIKSPTVCDALSKPPFTITHLTKFQEKILHVFNNLNSAHVFIHSAPGTGKSLLSLIFIISKFIENQHYKKICHSGPYLKPKWLIIVPTPQLSDQLNSWSKLLIPAQFHSYFDQFCHIGTPRCLLFDLIEEKYTTKYLQGIFIDEADAVLQPASRYAPRKTTDHKLSPGSSLLSCIRDLNSDDRLGAPPLPRLILSSATMNALVKSHLFKLKYFKPRQTNFESLSDFDKTVNPSLDLNASSPELSPASPNASFPLLPLSQCTSHVRNIIELITGEDEEIKDAASLLDSKVSILSSILAEPEYQQQLMLIFLPKHFSKADFASSLVREYSKSQYMTPNLPTLRIGYFNEIRTIVPDDKSQSLPHVQHCDAQKSSQPGCKPGTNDFTTILIGSEEDSRGIHFPALKAVFIIGSVSSHSTFIHMSGRVGRLSSTVQFQSQDVIFILSREEFTQFKKILKDPIPLFYHR